MKISKFIALFLAILMLSAVLFSCVDDKTTTDTTVASKTTTNEEVTVTEEISRENTADNLPDLNFNGSTVNIYYRDSTNYKLDFIADALTGDRVNDAIFIRNANVEERLNIQFNFIAGPNGSSDYCNKVKTLTLSDDPGFDIVSAYQAYTIPLYLEGCFHDLSQTQYLDFSQPWWAYDYMTEIQVSDDKIFFLQGDIALFMLGSMGVVYFNKDIYEDKIGDPEELYNDVLDGNFTMDLFAEYSEMAYDDKNGNSIHDDGDIYGFAATTSKSTEHFMYDAGVRSSSRDENGYPTIDINNEFNIEFMEKLYTLYYQNNGALISTTDGDINSFITNFTDGELLFLPGWLYMAAGLQNMEDEYGIIPFPKLDTDVEEYKSLVHDGTTIYCVAQSCANIDMISAVLEATCAESYRKVTPEYFDVALKCKYSKDEQSASILDMLRENITTDFLYANNYSFSTNIGLLCRTLMQQKSYNLSSIYAKVITPSQQKLDEIITNYTTEEQ